VTLALKNPRSLFRRVAIAEAVTWALLLSAMVLRTAAHDLGERAVSVFGMVHGVVFIAFCLVTLLVWIDQRWPALRGVLALLSAIPPFATVLFDWYAERRGLLAEEWRLRTAPAAGPSDRLVAWLLGNPAKAALTGVLAVAVLTAAALAVGPPAG
jgi:integral membrane protein